MSSGAPADPNFCYLTTSGRITGRPHRVEIWFAMHSGTVYLLSGDGDRSDWVRNLMVAPDVVVEIDGRKRTTRARVVSDPATDDLARGLLLEKYRPRYGRDLTAWGATALPVEIEWPDA